jgi:predicted DsbA family dithiol-disulfide isomerase
VPNIQQFNDCVESEKYADEVAEDLADAELAGGRGTPYSILTNDRGESIPLNGALPYEQVKAAVDSLLAE